MDPNSAIQNHFDAADKAGVEHERCTDQPLPLATSFDEWWSRLDHKGGCAGYDKVDCFSAWNDAVRTITEQWQRKYASTVEIWATENLQRDAEKNALNAEIANLTAQLYESQSECSTLAWRLDILDVSIKEMPGFQISFNQDPDIEDSIGMVPAGWNMRCDSVCVEPLTINASTFRECIDKLGVKLGRDQ